MSSNLFLNDYIYHMVHINNFKSILAQNALLSKTQLVRKRIQYRSIANDEVQSLRAKIYVWDEGNQSYRGLHDYVPFYFCAPTPMLWNNRGNQEQIIYLAVRRSILRESGSLFTDGNATNQQLSHGNDIVYIDPANSIREGCSRSYYEKVGHREYRLSEPAGNNTDTSDFYCDISCLPLLDWICIDEKEYRGGNVRRRQAEALILNEVPLSRVDAIFVYDQIRRYQVNELINRYRRNHILPDASIEPGYYY